ncbi:MAG: hypothetical protein R2860_16265 [Desulfobacterales bacterium]
MLTRDANAEFTATVDVNLPTSGNPLWPAPMIRMMCAFERGGRHPGSGGVYLFLYDRPRSILKKRQKSWTAGKSAGTALDDAPTRH